MTELFPSAPHDNLLPYHGILNDLGIVIEDAHDLYETLLADLPWQSDIVTVFGKTHVTTRQIVWMGDQGTSYRYSGHTHQSVPWLDTVFHVKQLIEELLLDIGIEVHFNSCLLNYYPTGNDGMGYHADDEKELGDRPIIASLSLGAMRKFIFKHKKTQDKVALYLESGQLLVMQGTTQTFWKHSIAKTTTVDNGRISLTFRRMLV
ncbi:alpha-ketoglutarate-dependent dioxygenase AlkB family protein [Psychrobacter sp. DM4]|uniref:alpha-ketoglutarate-dependent dioxygenase AlkB family protein n=1 Tax=Psychrobacter sp. DM4 TaxID=3440637 RepID=UPI003F509ECC